MKYHFSALQVFCALFLCLCFNSNAMAVGPKIAFINPGGDNGFWGDVSSVMREAATQLDIELEIFNANRNRLNMIRTAEMLAERPNKPEFVVAVSELQQGPTILKILGEAGISVYFLLNTISEDQIATVSSRKNTLIGSLVPDNFQAGYEMLESLVLSLREKKGGGALSFLAILGDDVTPAAIEREAGMRLAAETLTNVTIGRSFSVLWDSIVAREWVSKALKFIEVDGIWAANDQHALAARDVLDRCEEVFCQDVQVAGLNWSSEGVEAVENGRLLLTHGGHFLAGGWAMIALYDLAVAGIEPGHQTFSMSVIDEENVQEFAERLRAKRWDKIDFRQFSRSFQGEDFSFDPVKFLQKVH